MDGQGKIVDGELKSRAGFVEPPGDCKVVLYASDLMSRSFMTEMLITIFLKSEAEAIAILEEAEVYNEVEVAKYTYDIAYTSVNLVLSKAKSRGLHINMGVESL